MNIWFTSDEHYGHRNVIEFCKRPFKGAEEMTEKLIENHNKVVRKGDLVYHLGDMFWRTLSVGEAISIVKRLNGQQYYIFGNHDELFRNKILQQQFVWCKDVHNLKVDGYPNIFLCHYAMRTFNGSHKGAWQLYGHSHGQLPEITKNESNLEKGYSPYAFDVGVDAQGFTPISLEQVQEKMREKGWN